MSYVEFNVGYRSSLILSESRLRPIEQTCVKARFAVCLVFAFFYRYFQHSKYPIKENIRQFADVYLIFAFRY